MWVRWGGAGASSISFCQENAGARPFFTNPQRLHQGGPRASSVGHCPEMAQKAPKKRALCDLTQPATCLPSGALALAQPARALLGLRGLNNLGNT